MSYFRLYQLSLKLKMFVDISCRDQKLGTYKEIDRRVCDRVELGSNTAILLGQGSTGLKREERRQ